MRDIFAVWSHSRQRSEISESFRSIEGKVIPYDDNLDSTRTEAGTAGTADYEQKRLGLLWVPWHRTFATHHRSRSHRSTPIKAMEETWPSCRAKSHILHQVTRMLLIPSFMQRSGGGGVIVDLDRAMRGTALDAMKLRC